ncbi:LysR family transcriptional regulator [Rhodospirillum rubrum]|uniref:Transcriptional regulator, LysR family n=1 Tax=Rhodospirillum rubrum (strain ATCC 11170 / ATH 1.1.1 / DSM 467 / LMG 4362 / NCIMB 8255 / S1) TaxID=269796 RepID=Q2RW87_RHORT|nr:LysR family transcriptional regulator [Rhodospirillum rubrum]ABC21608.1 transcriptional regulator, LysR family [Rhodospirillum rubrum ATCC 11170]AEO47295.1 LysR family transcriptional regulator [Rhodospirillum rubrum F11]QXG81278.1 LysR family transcriptional regulator [Rhodospirillum rubrum]HAP99750.1 LysR family transcriptional regulator [Rhodospirillum rubrum]HCF17374.1 LysR family transcriptional regulator [Rhodospirillum rubrum]
MGIRVSTISRCIGHLEDEIGVALFLRRPNGVTLTFAGEQFLVRARRAMTEVRHAICEAGIAGTGRNGFVRLGLLSSLAAPFPAMLIKIYCAAYPGVRILYSEGGAADHRAALQHHRLDLAFLPHPEKAEGCDALGLWEERLFAAMAQDDPLTRHDVVTWDDLRERHFIFSEVPPGPELLDYLTERLVGFGFLLKADLLTVYRDTVMRVIANGSDVTVIGEARVSHPIQGVACRPITGESLFFHAVWLPTNDNPAFRRFLSLAKVLSKQCSVCELKEGLAGPSGEDHSVMDETSASLERKSRLLKIVSERCATCLLKKAIAD